MINGFYDLIESIYGRPGDIALHEPKFIGNELTYIRNAIQSTFVSSVGEYVDEFEKRVREITGVESAVSTVNGTSALHVALKLANVSFGDLVLTQSLTFVATCNAISYCGAQPVFLDVSEDRMSIDPDKLEVWLRNYSEIDVTGKCVHRGTGKTIRACVPMHTYGHPADLDGLVSVCRSYNIAIIEDAAEALGSIYKGKHVGAFGEFGILSFNGNKIITTGGGGIVLTNLLYGVRAKHLTTTARITSAQGHDHDEIGFNYRMPNLNAALGCAQIEKLDEFIFSKREIASRYKNFFSNTEYRFFDEPSDSKSNYWLSTIIAPNESSRDKFLSEAHLKGVQVRPAWRPMHKLIMYKNCLRDDLPITDMLASRIINLPSSATCT